MNKNNNDQWHTNKNYSISIILLLISNIAATAWWASSITSDVDLLKSRPDLTERVIRLETNVDLYNNYFKKLDAALIRMETTIDRIDREQARRKSIVDRAERSQEEK